MEDYNTPETPIDEPGTILPKSSPIQGILEAIDNEDARSYFLMMLGYAPTYDDKGHFIGYEKVKKPDFDDQLMGLLSAIRSGKVMAIANIEDSHPLSSIEVEWTVEFLQELVLMQAPPDVDILHYLVPAEWAKFEMKKNLSLAKKGQVLRAVIGFPGGEGEPKFVEPPGERERRKGGLLGKLLGGGEE